MRNIPASGNSYRHDHNTNRGHLFFPPPAPPKYSNENQSSRKPRRRFALQPPVDEKLFCRSTERRETRS